MIYFFPNFQSIKIYILVLNFKIQVDSFLAAARDLSYRNDIESIEFFREKIPNFINGILNQK